MILHIIVVAYENPIRLRILLGSFIVQTCPDWKIYIIHDGLASDDVIRVVRTYKELCKRLFNDKDKIVYQESEKRMGNYGHPNRAAMLKNIKGDPYDYVLITNDDNYYVPKFVEFFLYSCNEEIGLVYCNTLHSYYAYDVHQSQIKEKCIDMGCFIVRLDIAQKTGFNHYDHSADGKYAEECMNNCINNRLRSRYIPKALFIHN